jgi:hypothetical protein
MSIIEPGDSIEQRTCEAHILSAVAAMVGCELIARRFVVPNGGYFSVDGCNDDGSILCEAWAHHGPPKPAQQSKVMKDAAKLFLAGTLAGRPTRKLLAFADADAARPFQGRSWMREALRVMGIEVIVVDILDEIRADVRAAQIRQYR